MLRVVDTTFFWVFFVLALCVGPAHLKAPLGIPNIPMHTAFERPLKQPSAALLPVAPLYYGTVLFLYTLACHAPLLWGSVVCHPSGVLCHDVAAPTKCSTPRAAVKLTN